MKDEQQVKTPGCLGQSLCLQWVLYDIEDEQQVKTPGCLGQSLCLQWGL
jgi:hypothetical protein